MGLIRRALFRIVQDRRETGTISQKRLAERMKCSQSQVSSLLSGERRLNEDWILLFCEALEIQPSQLFAAAEQAVQNQSLDTKRHRDLHRRLQRLLDDGCEDLADLQLSILEAYARRTSKDRRLPS